MHTTKNEFQRTGSRGSLLRVGNTLPGTTGAQSFFASNPAHNHRPVFPVEVLGIQPAALPDHRLPTPRALAEQKRRIVALNCVSLYVKAGHPKCQAARLAGSKYNTAWRWQKLREAGGDEALLPQTNRCGRRSEFNAPDSALSKVESLALALGSPRQGWLKFARTADCPPELARAIRRRSGYVPQSLMSQISLRTINARLLLGPTQFCIVLPKGGPR